MDEKKLKEIKEANKKITEGNLTIWNARLDILANAGRERDLANYLGRPIAGVGMENVYGCPDPGPENVYGCDPDDPWPDDVPNTSNCPEERLPTNPGRPADDFLSELAGKVNLIVKDINQIKEKIK